MISLDVCLKKDSHSHIYLIFYSLQKLIPKQIKFGSPKTKEVLYF